MLFMQLIRVLFRGLPVGVAVSHVASFCVPMSSNQRKKMWLLFFCMKLYVTVKTDFHKRIPFLNRQKVQKGKCIFLFSASCVAVKYKWHIRFTLLLIRNSHVTGFQGNVTCSFYPLEGLCLGCNDIPYLVTCHLPTIWMFETSRRY